MFYFTSTQSISLILTAIVVAITTNYYLQVSDSNTDSGGLAASITSSRPNTISSESVLGEPMTKVATATAALAKSSSSSLFKQTAQKAMSTTTLSHAKIVHRPSSTRGHADHGWLNTYHSFSFANWYDPRFESFGALRVLNEDRVAPNTGFPTHPHRDAEIFSYILSGELTHRDSMQKRGAESGSDKTQFYRMKRGDVQFTTGGTGIAHSEQNEHASSWVHFLQIWVLPWKKGLTPIYHTDTFPETNKRQGFVTIISPLAAGPEASAQEEKEALPSVPGTIPIHADLLFSAAILAPGSKFDYTIGTGSVNNDNNDSTIVRSSQNRKTYIHLPRTSSDQKKAIIKLDGRDNCILHEGDGAFVTGVHTGDTLSFESIGDGEAEVVVLDSN